SRSQSTVDSYLLRPSSYRCLSLRSLLIFFFFHAPAPTALYTLSLHDALPISAHPVTTPPSRSSAPMPTRGGAPRMGIGALLREGDRKSTRLNSSHSQISYAVFCLKKKKKKNKN